MRRYCRGKAAGIALAALMAGLTTSIVGATTSLAAPQSSSPSPFATFYGSETFLAQLVSQTGTSHWIAIASWHLVWASPTSDAGRDPTSSLALHYNLVDTPAHGSTTTLCNGELPVVPGRNLVDQFIDGGNGVAPQSNGTATVVVTRPTTYLDGEACRLNGIDYESPVPDPLPGQLQASGRVSETGTRLTGVIPVFAHSAGSTAALGGGTASWAVTLNGTVVFGSPLVYTALGDSFSSGVFQPEPASGDCYRSADAYPEVYDPGKVVFLACSGATSTDVLLAQVPAVPPDSAIVSVTAGGDNIPVFSVLIDCITYRFIDRLYNFSLGDPCFLHENIDLAQVLPRVQAQLVELFLAVHRQAPHARIYALGYPDPVPQSFRADSCPGLEKAEISYKGPSISVPAVDPRDASFFHGLAEALNTRVRAAAHDSGVVQYVAPFSGHDLCSSDSWFLPMSKGFPSALHPNAAGQEQMAVDLRRVAGPPPA
jgi:hypothetical protein